MTYTFIGGDIALDLVGTLQKRRTEPRDLLDTPAALGSWAVAAGLVDATPTVDEDALARTIELREALYRLASARDTPEGYGARDRATLNGFAAGTPVAVALAADGRVRRTGDITAVLATVARSAVTLFGGADAARVRECEAPTCTRLYVDSSRHGSRRWCDMRGCGNRAKAANFRARHRDGQAADA